MLTRPVPFPDELDRSYLGQVMRLNGIATEEDAENLMRAWAGIGEKSIRDVSRIELLSKVAGTEVTTFVREHSTLPLRRGITSYHPDLEHGSATNPNMLWSSGMRLARPEAFCCEMCVREDLEFHGQSYWRREHQIPGLFWCPKHGTLLRFLNDEAAFLQSPAACLDHAQSLTDDWVVAAKNNPTIQRFLDICSNLMDRRFPINNKVASTALRNLARAAGYWKPSSNGSDAPLLSDAVIEKLGRPWLATVLPKWADKSMGKISSKLDVELFTSATSFPVIAYIVASAVLFRSADAAINALDEPKLNRDNKHILPPCIADREAVASAYVQASGSYSKAATLLSADKTSVADRLQSAGLPNLVEHGRHNLLIAAKAFFIEGLSLRESAELGGISPETMESIVRIAGCHMSTLLQGMHGSKRSKRSAHVPASAAGNVRDCQA